MFDLLPERLAQLINSGKDAAVPVSRLACLKLRHLIYCELYLLMRRLVPDRLLKKPESDIGALLDTIEELDDKRINYAENFWSLQKLSVNLYRVTALHDHAGLQ